MRHLKNIFLISLVLGGLAPYSNASDHPQPKVFAAERNHDFGKIALNTTAFHEFQIVNRGKAPLHILNLSSDCNCTAAIAGSRILEPEKATQIQLTFNSLGRRGKFLRTVEVQTDDPLNPILRLSVSGFIEQGLVVVPPIIDFGTLHKGQLAQKEIVVRYPAFTPQGIRSIEQLPEFETISEQDFTTSPPGTRIKIKLNLHLPIGILKRNLILYPNNDLFSPFRIPVYARIMEAIEVTPTSLVFIVKSDTPPAEEILKILNHQGKPFKIAKVEYDESLFDVNLKPSSVLHRYDLSIKLKKTSELRNIATRMILLTSDPEYPKITVPIQILVLKTKSEL